MLAQQISVKIFAAGEIDQESLIPVFHRWIRDEVFDEHLLIDVADYRHVPEGPGIMIIGHEAQLGIDEGLPGPGLLYTRRRDELGELDEKIRETLGWAALVASKLEHESEFDAKFDPNRMLIEIRSRLTTEDFSKATEELVAAARRVGDPVFGADFEVRGREDEARLVGVVVNGGGALESVAALEEHFASARKQSRKRKLQIL